MSTATPFSDHQKEFTMSNQDQTKLPSILVVPYNSQITRLNSGVTLAQTRLVFHNMDPENQDANMNAILETLLDGNKLTTTLLLGKWNHSIEGIKDGERSLMHQIAVNGGLVFRDIMKQHEDQLVHARLFINDLMDKLMPDSPCRIQRILGVQESADDFKIESSFNTPEWMDVATRNMEDVRFDAILELCAIAENFPIHHLYENNPVQGPIARKYVDMLAYHMGSVGLEDENILITEDSSLCVWDDAGYRYWIEPSGAEIPAALLVTPEDLGHTQIDVQAQESTDTPKRPRG